MANWSFENLWGQYNIQCLLNRRLCLYSGWNLVRGRGMITPFRGDLWAPYNRMIFELLDRLCQIIENCSFLLTLQLSNCRVSCQKSFLEIISELMWMVIYQKFLIETIFLKMAKNINHSTIQFLIVAALNPKSNYVRLASQ